MKDNKVRVLRVIEYIGTREDIQKQLEGSGLPNNGQKTINKVLMKSALIGDFPEIIDFEDEV